MMFVRSRKMLLFEFYCVDGSALMSDYPSVDDSSKAILFGVLQSIE